MDKTLVEGLVRRVAAGAEVVNTPCAEGEMKFRRWNRGGGDIVVLLHGGSGSWTHWIANIEPLSAQFDVVAMDLPGLGESAALPEGYSAADAARWTAEGLRRVIGDARFHLVCFSWGCTVGATLAPGFGDKVRSMMLTGPAALGDILRRPQMQPLLRRNRGMTEAQIFETNRENLARLMIHDRQRIDDLAVWLQTENTNRSRFNSPQFARSSLVLDGLRQVSAPLYVVYGEFDAPAYPNFEIREQRLREVRPDLTFEIIDGGGHWVQYELADVFNRKCIDWILANT
ncbi:MAG TPA: alpha/beta hydrolase [Pseudomonadales bacterium]|nr:alpha/beta hydrolase [Pseudomonadales bacterium]